MVRIVTSVHPNAGRFLSFVYILQTTWMSNEKPVENPNLGRKKTYNVDVVVITIIAIKREKQCRISVFLLCGRLSGMYLCITCGPHFAHCLSYDIKQFLGLKWYTFLLLLAQLLNLSSAFFPTTNPLTQFGFDHKPGVVLLLMSHLGREHQLNVKMWCNVISFNTNWCYSDNLLLLEGFEHWLWLVGVRWQSCLYHMTLAVAT